MKMKLTIFALLLAYTLFIHALTVSQSESFSQPRSALSEQVEQRSDPVEWPSDESPVVADGALEKRRGGGRGGGGGGGGKTGGSSSSKGGGKTGSSSSSGSSIGGSSRGFGGGRYYGGGSMFPYSSGNRSPGGITPYLLPIAALGIFPGLWLWSAFAYPYPEPFHFMNRTAANNTFPDGVDQTLPVLCLCQQFTTCGCDGNEDQAFVDELLGNGSVVSLNKTLVQVANVNGTTTLVLNGTLSNQTTAPTAQGAASRAVGESVGWWILGAVVGWTIWMI